MWDGLIFSSPLSASGNDQYLITSATTTAILRVYHHDH